MRMNAPNEMMSEGMQEDNKNRTQRRTTDADLVFFSSSTILISSDFKRQITPNLPHSLSLLVNVLRSQRGRVGERAGRAHGERRRVGKNGHVIHVAIR